MGTGGTGLSAGVASLAPLRKHGKGETDRRTGRSAQQGQHSENACRGAFLSNGNPTARSENGINGMDRPRFYLASPYTHRDFRVVKDRAYFASVAVVELMKAGVRVYSPIHYTHSIADCLPTGWDDFWRDESLDALSRCDGLLVLQLDGWSESVGVRAEIKWAHENYMPTWYWDSVTTPAAAIAEVLNCVKRRRHAGTEPAAGVTEAPA